MTIANIKKELYRRKPHADLVKVTKSGILYNTSFYDVDENKKVTERVLVHFLVPLDEIGDAVFGPTGVESQLLIRYMVSEY